jgi:hypothetical protein
MNGRKLQDRLYLGLGLSARHTGRIANAFRPSGPNCPLDKQNRFLKLPAAFNSAKGNVTHANGYGDALWYGIFDASYTRPGDYIVLETAVYFIGSQDPLLPVLCVRTNRTISVAKPRMQTNPAANAYGGYTSANSSPLLDQWPASVFNESKSSSSITGLPTDQLIPYWTVLIPATSGVTLSSGDVITDDLGRTAFISGSELSNLGWRISAKMMTT